MNKAELEKLSDFELSKIIALRSKYAIDFDINSWSDMGSLINENKISLKWNGGVYEKWTARSIHAEGVHDTNPLRAAAIVYLLIKDKENE